MIPLYKSVICPHLECYVLVSLFQKGCDMLEVEKVQEGVTEVQNHRWYRKSS